MILTNIRLGRTRPFLTVLIIVSSKMTHRLHSLPLQCRPHVGHLTLHLQVSLLLVQGARLVVLVHDLLKVLLAHIEAVLH